MPTKKCRKEYQRAWREKNAEHVRQWNIEYRKANLETLKAKALVKDKERRSLEKATQRESLIYKAAKARAKMSGIEFTISKEDIVIPEVCPLLKTPINLTRTVISDDSPSLDRIDNALGYVKGNVWVISNRANRIKGNSTWQELELIAKNLKDFLSNG